ncbi:hypothetical protein GGTG_05489 [Gaeumannomyces tritici R3-111a-1]|uniref:Heterokaryon incompatibility domain-containing protein n=1 Tax=Gaeumannomyces tritici (strain R3-111a-1) TaxID=644352 RepID=J3NW26_GAET3|nr:hypothetical protein GGTG_05489 [Gaeumannomyces tritici R3-111a-1]EJT75556.1 hypothetical protein GGTG_05489 [Gaeumannomyces tritici R3-111a-1]
MKDQNSSEEGEQTIPLSKQRSGPCGRVAKALHQWRDGDYVVEFKYPEILWTELFSSSSSCPSCLKLVRWPTPDRSVARPRDGKKLRVYLGREFCRGSSMILYRNMGQDTISSKLLHSWISTCDSRHHGVCHHIQPSEFLPSPPRIPLADLQRQRLVTVSNVGSYQYVTLSYVWGDTSGQLATTKANFGQLQQDGQLPHTHHSLPATVRDAILFAKQLDVHYIWVDRFCIVQGGAKEESISWMTSIDAHAYFTVVAASSIDAKAGIKGIGSPSGPRRCEDTSFYFEDVEYGTG